MQGLEIQNNERSGVLGGIDITRSELLRTRIRQLYRVMVQNSGAGVVRNYTDYADEARYESILLNLAKSDDGGNIGAPPAAESTVAALNNVKIESENEAMLCVVCKDLVTVGETVEHNWFLPGIGENVKPPQIFQLGLLQNFLVNMFCNIPVKKVRTFGDLRNVLMKRIFLPALHFRINTRYKMVNTTLTSHWTIACSAVQESSASLVATAEIKEKKEVKPKLPAKAPAKTLPQMMEEAVIPSLKSILETQDDISEIELSFEDDMLYGSFVKKNIRYSFWAFFPDGVLTASLDNLDFIMESYDR